MNLRMEPELAHNMQIAMDDVDLRRNDEGLDQIEPHHQNVLNATDSQRRCQVEIFRAVVGLMEAPEYPKFCNNDHL